MLDAKTLVVMPEPAQELSMSATEHIQRRLSETLPGYHCIVFAEGGDIYDFRGDVEATRLARELKARIDDLALADAA